MANNIIIPTTGAGDATPTVSTDKVGSAHMQNVKLDVGAAGASSPLVRGQQTKANSLPLVLASDSTVEGDLDKLVLQNFDLDSGAGVSAGIGFAQLLPASGGPVVGGTATNPIRTDPTGTTTQPVSATSLPLPTGAAADATLAGVLTTSDFDTKAGSLTETAPVSDTASSGLNGRLQRIAQRLTSILTALGSPFQAGGSIGNTTFAATAISGGFVDGAIATIGAKADGKNAATDTTAITAMSVWKQISASVQALVTGTVLAAGTALVGLVGRKPSYGAKTTITWTGASLANGSARECTAIDNTANRFADVRIRIQSKGQASGTAYLDFYVYTALGDTTYTDAATGSDAAFTAANRRNARYLGSVLLNANTSAVQAEFMLSDIFQSMPDKWGLIGINNSGAALSATAGDHVLEYEGVN